MDLDHDDGFVFPLPTDRPHRPFPEATGLVFMTDHGPSFADESIEPEPLDEDPPPLGVALPVDRLGGDGLRSLDHFAAHRDPVPCMDSKAITESEGRPSFGVQP